MRAVAAASRCPRLHLSPTTRPTARQYTSHTTHHSRHHVKFLVIDGYIQWGREDLESGGAVTAGQLYADMLVRATPSPYTASYDLIFPADPGFELPDLSQVRMLLCCVTYCIC